MTAAPGANGNAELLESLRRRYVAAQLVGDRREALRLAVDEALGAGLRIEDIQRGVIEAAQRQIGELWETDEISVAQEHLATAISQVVLSQLYLRGAAEKPNGKKVLVACVPGELHDFPARLVADALDLAGFQVLFLGASVPVGSLLEMVAREKPAVVALSITMPSHVGGLAEVVKALKAVGPWLQIAVGGHACVSLGDLATSVGADITAPDAATLVRETRARLGIPVA